MSGRDDQARRLIVCTVCRHDKAHIYRNADGTLTAACSGCGYEMLTVQREPATAA